MVMSPGPNGALLLKTVSTSGKKHGYINVLGILSAFYIHGTFSIFGLSAILVSSASLFFIVKLIGALYLAYLGAKAIVSAFSRPKTHVAPEIVPQRVRLTSLYASYLEGLLTNILNPKVSIFYLAAFPQFVSFQSGAVVSSYILVTIHALVAAIWFSFVVIFIGKFSAVFKSHISYAILQSAIGSILLWFSYRVATASSK